MVKVETSVVINRPIAEVFEFVVNPEKWPQYDSGLLEAAKTSKGPMDVGATWQEVRKFLGRRIESTNAVTAYEPNKKFSFKSTSGPFPVEGGLPSSQSRAAQRSPAQARETQAASSSWPIRSSPAWSSDR